MRKQREGEIVQRWSEAESFITFFSHIFALPLNLSKFDTLEWLDSVPFLAYRARGDEPTAGLCIAAINRLRIAFRCIKAYPSTESDSPATTQLKPMKWSAKTDGAHWETGK